MGPSANHHRSHSQIRPWTIFGDRNSKVRQYWTTDISRSRLLWMPLQRRLLWTNSRPCGKPSMLTSAFSTTFSYFIPRRPQQGVTSLILKEDQPTSPAEFRPITVTSTILRLFHKILASRLDTIPINNAKSASNYLRRWIR